MDHSTWQTQKQSNKHANSRSMMQEKKNFELGENICAVYSTETINTNQVCPKQNSVESKLSQSGDVVMINPAIT
jgi:hypothetical protein